MTTRRDSEKRNKIVAFLEKVTTAVSTKHRFIGLVLVFFGALGIMQILGAIMKTDSGTASELDMRLWYTHADISATLGMLGHSGQRVYAKWLLLDFVMAFCLMLIQMRFLRSLYGKLAHPQRYAFCLVFPALRTLLDTAENCFLLLFTLALPEPGQPIAMISACVTLGKWIMMYLILACFVLFALKATLLSIRKLILQKRMQ